MDAIRRHSSGIVRELTQALTRSFRDGAVSDEAGDRVRNVLDRRGLPVQHRAFQHASFNFGGMVMLSVQNLQSQRKRRLTSRDMDAVAKDLLGQISEFGCHLHLHPLITPSLIAFLCAGSHVRQYGFTQGIVEEELQKRQSLVGGQVLDVLKRVEPLLEQWEKTREKKKKKKMEKRGREEQEKSRRAEEERRQTHLYIQQQ